MTDDEIVQKLFVEARDGEKAQELLGSDLYKQIWAAQQERILDALAASAEMTEKQCKTLQLMLYLLRSMEAEAKRMAEGGKLAKIQLEQRERRTFGQTLRQWIGRDGLIESESSN